MRAAVLYAPGDIRIEHRPDPTVQPGHVVVRVERVGVCGSDLPRLLVKGAHRMPLICGHEFSGRIVAVGAEIAGWEEGELVAVPPLIPCFICEQCRRGQYSRCRDYDYFGSRRDGAYAEYVSVPATNLLKTPDGIDPRAVAMVDPASIALHALWKAGGVTVGQRGAVVGCGPIGLFAIEWMRLMGASEVTAVDVSEAKLALARQAGATTTVLAHDLRPEQHAVDVVIEAVGVDQTINAAVRMAAPGGHVSFIGIPVRDVSLDNAAFQHLLRQEISLHGSWNSFGAPFPGGQWTITLDKMAKGEIGWEFMISHDLDLDELPATFAGFRTSNDFFSKVMFRP